MTSQKSAVSVRVVYFTRSVDHGVFSLFRLREQRGSAIDCNSNGGATRIIAIRLFVVSVFYVIFFCCASSMRSRFSDNTHGAVSCQS